MTEPKADSKQTLFYLAIFTLVAVALVALWLLLAKDSKKSDPPLEQPVVQIQPQPEPAIEPKPEPEVPDLANEEVTGAEADLTPEPVPQPEPELPALDNSDAEVYQRLLALNWRPGLANLFVSEELLRNLVVQVDNIAQGQLASAHPLLQPLPERFSVAPGQPLLLAEQSFARYQPYVQLLESVPPQQIVALFNRYEPLLQQAFAEQGYPDDLFKNRLLQAIDVLLATPEVKYPLALEQPSVMYQFADPVLEQLPAAQKLMLRLGPDNQQRIKLLLQRYKNALQP
ncbi:DUF3014 domain-containing protein [Rheinheimera sp.]|uniref:DUF3014 domain-containing protein n=1 Tax=Rheinheimera sp. TaxID=1869214 RepID=UPI004047F8B8